MEITARMAASARTARSAAAAGMVLLKNIGNALPLRKEGGKRLPVAVFGRGQLHPSAPGDLRPWRADTVLDALCDSDEVAPDGLVAHRYREAALGAGNFDETAFDFEELASENRAALVLLTRPCGDFNSARRRRSFTFSARFRRPSRGRS